MVPKRTRSGAGIQNTLRAATAFLAAMLLASALSGCQQLFTTSLASSLARKTISIPSDLSPSEAAKLAKQATNDPTLANALVTSLVQQISTTTDPTTKSELEATAAGVAINASQVSSAITPLISNYANGGGTPDAATLESLLSTIQTSTTPADLTALKYLQSGTLTPAQVQGSGLGPTDLAVAAVVLASSAIPSGADLSDPTAYFNDNPTVDTAITATGAPGIMVEAKQMLPSGSQSSGLLNQISQYFLPTT